MRVWPCKRAYTMSAVTSRHIGKSGASPMHTATLAARSFAATSGMNHDGCLNSIACRTRRHTSSAARKSSSRSSLHSNRLGSCHTTAASFSRKGCT